ncbi:hypothetical protein PoB_003413300 [Plakobranchus ocellatus]|uniref:Uncharacterized protein n=1 Tax=Plakobranchus ocellatus TaxID=259542 RepID=A0AAV4AK00_9GAST|nr:hypothetical protein PoB_003413300 [Plakobranchus ocellatus]
MVSLCPRMKNIRIMVLGLVILFITAAMMFTYPMINPNPTKQMSVNFKSRISAETNVIENELEQMKVSSQKGQEESKRDRSQDGKQQKSNKNDEEQAGKEPDRDEELTGQELEKGEEVTGQEPEKVEEVTGQEPEGDKINDEVDDDKSGSDNYYYGESGDPADSEEGETSSRFFGFFDGVANTDWSWLKPFQSSSPFRDPAPAPYDAIFEDEEGYDSDNETETQAKPNKLEGSDDNDNSDNEISEKSKSDDDGDKDIEDENNSNDVDNIENPGSIPQASEQGATDEKTDTEEDKKEEQSGDEQTNGETGKVKPKTQDFKAVSKPQSSNARQKDQSLTARPHPEQLGEKQLVEIFENKLRNITVKEMQMENTCFDKSTLANSCDNGRCLRTKLPTPPEERVKQLINRPGLIISDSQHEVLREMAAQVTKKPNTLPQMLDQSEA